MAENGICYQKEPVVRTFTTEAENMRDFLYLETVDLEKVGNRIKKVRLSHDLTVEQFAEILNVSENAVYKWQRGETAPDIINFGYISSRFDVSLDYLIMGRGDGDEPSPLHLYGVFGIRESRRKKGPQDLFCLRLPSFTLGTLVSLLVRIHT